MKKQRLILIDLLRLVSFFAIIIYHAISAVFETIPTEGNYRGVLFYALEPFARAISFSGLSIIVLSSYLLALQELTPAKVKRLLLVLTVGGLLIFFTQAESLFGGYFWEWDIYQFLMVAVLTLLWLEKNKPYQKVFALLGFIMTWIPFHLLGDEAAIPLLPRHILFGVCDGTGRGGWALLPWLGLAWFTFYFAKIQKETLSKSEKWFWAGTLLASLPWLGSYFDVSVSNNFYCYIFRKPAWEMWAHLVWIFFFLRIAPLPAVQRALHNQAWLRKIAELKISTHFGLSYLIGLILMWLGSFLEPQMRSHLWLFDIFLLSFLPITELLTRFVLNLSENNQGPSKAS